MIKPSGKVLYKDEYDQIYDVQWETVNGLIDITTIIKQPYVWGEEPRAYVRNGVLYRFGIITTQRQILKLFDGGYEIVAEGASQIEDYIQTNYQCERGPVDNFAYHLNCSISDDIENKVYEGVSWVDPDESNDTIWGYVDPSGTVTSGGTEDQEILQWIDVWVN